VRLVQRGCFDSVFNAGGREFPIFRYQSTKLTTAVHIAGIACGKLTFHRPISQHSADSSTSGTCMLPLKHFATRLKILIGRNCARSSKAFD